MRHNKFQFILLLCLISTSCIEEFTPVIDDQDVGLYVIEGRVTSKPGIQKIFVSKSAPIDDPDKIIVDNCQVTIQDNNGNEFPAIIEGDGSYEAYIAEEFLFDGNAFRIEVITPEGSLIRSDYDTLHFCPVIDTVYYETEGFYTSDPEKPQPGVQFYIDFNGRGNNQRRIKFEVEETYKYEVPYPIKWTWDGRTLTTYEQADYSLSVCWRTDYGNQLYTLSTEKLDDNVYKRFPLHHVLDNSYKLLMGYSILYRQLVLSENAFIYHEKINDNLIDNGSLYETQPQMIRGNLYNITDPSQRVLGFFYAAGISEKRIFYSQIDGLKPKPYELCTPISLDLGYGMIRNISEPIYLWLEKGMFLLDEMCVDCRTRGGTTTKPEFWP